MNEIVIKVENISKLYQLGEVGTGTLSRDLERWWAAVRGREDPYAKIGQINDRTKKTESDFVWALKNINFEVKKGEVLGIIGGNGAGKSTLLKVLSKITTPTGGRINVNGRIASLLEVGTGFHPEMTGRENIYLNGALLGMRKWEIDKKFDEIVEFAGVEAFIDTPVKRYSSGMYVRLAFAVAAFLEPEILIIDEVLAVGDSEFQRKCLGRMKEVSRDHGRTVLFVSHNMTAIKKLCNNAILLNQGTLHCAGSVSSCINEYYNFVGNNKYVWSGVAGDETVTLLQTSIKSKQDKGFVTQIELEIEIVFQVHRNVKDLVVGFFLLTIDENVLAYCVSDDYNSSPIDVYSKGIYKRKFKIPANTLSKGQYKIQFDIGIHNKKRIINSEGQLSFELINGGDIGMRYLNSDERNYINIFRPNWEVF